MNLTRTRLLVEFGPYGPSLQGASLSSAANRYGTYPYNLDPKKELKRLKSIERRRDRLRELVREWVNSRRGGVQQDAASSEPANGSDH